MTASRLVAFERWHSNPTIEPQRNNRIYVVLIFLNIETLLRKPLSLRYTILNAICSIKIPRASATFQSKSAQSFVLVIKIGCHFDGGALKKIAYNVSRQNWSSRYRDYPEQKRLGDRKHSFNPFLVISTVTTSSS